MAVLAATIGIGSNLEEPRTRVARTRPPAHTLAHPRVIGIIGVGESGAGSEAGNVRVMPLNSSGQIKRRVGNLARNRIRTIDRAGEIAVVVIKIGAPRRTAHRVGARTSARVSAIRAIAVGEGADYPGGADFASEAIGKT